MYFLGNMINHTTVHPVRLDNITQLNNA